MSPAPTATTAHVPTCLWAQRDDRVFLTIAVEEIEKPEIKLEENSLKFSGVAKNNQLYELNIEFFGPINTVDSQHGIYGQKHWMFILMKKEAGPYWARLLKDSKKNHWLKADWNKWRDEDEDDEEEAAGAGGPPGGQDFGDMFKNMGGMGGMPGMGGMGGMPGMGGMGDEMPDLDDLDAEDSDDEKLPDLEENKAPATTA